MVTTSRSEFFLRMSGEAVDLCLPQQRCIFSFQRDQQSSLRGDHLWQFQRYTLKRPHLGGTISIYLRWMLDLTSQHGVPKLIPKHVNVEGQMGDGSTEYACVN